MHSSFFNYNLTRPYPYKWFTPVLLFGGLVLAVLLSIMNFVSNSYSLVVQYVDNPNSTIAQNVWFKDWPSYLTTGVQPTCEPANLPVNTQFFTNQSGLMWTISSVFADTNDPQALPSLPYLNNVLENCTVSEVRLDYDGSDDLDTSIEQNSPWNVEARAFVTCSVSGPSGSTFINATAAYDALTLYPMPGVSNFVARSATNRASMFWSEALLRAYWINAVSKVEDASDSMFQNAVEAGAGRAGLSKGVVTLYPNKIQQNITDLDFFDMQYDFLELRRGFGITGHLNSMAFYIGNDSSSADPHIWSSVDTLAKSMYSTVLADLGQMQYPTESSLVIQASVIQHLTLNFSDPIQFSLSGGIPPMLVQESYDARQSGPNPTGTLGLSPSVIATRYLCQVPRLKPKGDIFVSVLLADLVFLQLAWKTYTFLVDKFLLRRQPHAMSCESWEDHKQVLEASSTSNLPAGYYVKRSIQSSVRSVSETTREDALSLRSRSCQRYTP